MLLSPEHAILIRSRCLYLLAAHGAILSGTLAEPFGYKGQVGYYTDTETGLQLLTHHYYDPTTGRFLTRDPISYTGGINLYSYAANNPLAFTDRLGLKTGVGWYDTWEEIVDIRKSQKFWEDVREESIQRGNWGVATLADVENQFISVAQLDDIQEDGEILGSNASAGQKVLAAVDLVLIAESWFYCVSGSEFVPRNRDEFRIAPGGNRAWRRGWEPVRINQAPHYHRRISGPNGKTLRNGSVDWHRPWQKGF